MIQTKPKDKSLSVLIHEADDVFSKWIRKSKSADGYVYCFICSKRMRVAESQCGHFIDRDQMPTRYDEINCHPICQYCNCVDPSHRSRYVSTMVHVYGVSRVTDLNTRSKNLQKYMRHELVDIIESYKLKLKQLE